MPWSERGGYDFYDFVSSPLAQATGGSFLDGDPEMRIRLPYFRSVNFGVLDFEWEPEPKVTFSLRDVRGDRALATGDADGSGTEERRLELALEDRPERTRAARGARRLLPDSERLRDRAPGHELVVLALARRQVAAVLHDHEPVRETRAERRARHVEAVGFRHAVDAAGCIRDDVEDVRRRRCRPRAGTRRSCRRPGSKARDSRARPCRARARRPRCRLSARSGRPRGRFPCGSRRRPARAEYLKKPPASSATYRLPVSSSATQPSACEPTVNSRTCSATARRRAAVMRHWR